MSGSADTRDAVEAWIEASARPVDRTFFNVVRGNGDPDELLKSLSRFQNPDGGFGHGLEPDVRTPESSAIATSVAFQYLVDADIAADDPLVEAGIKYFLDSFDMDDERWPIIPPSVDEHPSAPWWDYQNSQRSETWGNPSSEILGYLLTYSGLSGDHDLIARLTDRSLRRLDEIVEPEFHELLCFTRLFGHLGEQPRLTMAPKLFDLVSSSVDPDPDNWASYQATPLTFVHTEESLFREAFSDELLEADIDRLLGSIVDGNHWEPVWTWGDAYPDAWKVASRDWSGALTVKSLLILENFGAIEPRHEGPSDEK